MNSLILSLLLSQEVMRLIKLLKLAPAVTLTCFLRHILESCLYFQQIFSLFSVKGAVKSPNTCVHVALQQKTTGIMLAVLRQCLYLHFNKSCSLEDAVWSTPVFFLHCMSSFPQPSVESHSTVFNMPYAENRIYLSYTYSLPSFVRIIPSKSC